MSQNGNVNFNATSLPCVFLSQIPPPDGLNTTIATLKKLCDARPEVLDAIDQVLQRPPGGINNPFGQNQYQKTEVNVNNVNIDQKTARPVGNTKDYGLRKLRKYAQTRPEVPMVIAHQGKPIATSLAVAQYFGKQHFDVLKAIRNLRFSASFNECNFALVEQGYQDMKGEWRPMYYLARDGCIALIMGFTGEKATQLQEQYINEFNRMEQELRERQHLKCRGLDTRHSAERKRRP